MPPGAHAFIVSGASIAIVSNRLSFAFKLKGASLSLDTACSSALVALDSGCKYLRLQACSEAICGGVQISDPAASLAMALAHELSGIGRCATFDAAADGFARGEGCGALWLEPAPTQTDAQHIFGSVLSLNVQHSGRSVSLTTPSGNAQQILLRTALRQSGVEEEEVTLVECHGTGTALGDPIELGALRAVLDKAERAVPLLFGTVKTNVAHTERASGVVGLIKSILHVHRSCAPANLHLRQLNNHLDDYGKDTNVFKS